MEWGTGHLDWYFRSLGYDVDRGHCSSKEHVFHVFSLRWELKTYEDTETAAGTWGRGRKKGTEGQGRLAEGYCGAVSPLHTNLQVVNFQRRECAWNCGLPSASSCWRSFNSTISVSRLLSLLQSVTLPACSLDASSCMPAVVLHYWTFKVLYSD